MRHPWLFGDVRERLGLWNTMAEASLLILGNVREERSDESLGFCGCVSSAFKSLRLGMRACSSVMA